MQSAIDLNSNFGAKKHCNQINFLIPNLVERKAHKLIASLGRSSIITAYLRKNIEQINLKRFIALGVGGRLKHVEVKQRLHCVSDLQERIILISNRMKYCRLSADILGNSRKL